MQRIHRKERIPLLDLYLVHSGRILDASSLLSDDIDNSTYISVRVRTRAGMMQEADDLIPPRDMSRLGVTPSGMSQTQVHPLSTSAIPNNENPAQDSGDQKYAVGTILEHMSRKKRGNT